MSPGHARSHQIQKATERAWSPAGSNVAHLEAAPKVGEKVENIEKSTHFFDFLLVPTGLHLARWAASEETHSKIVMQL